MLGLAVPAFAGLLGLAALPVVIHLLTRGRPRTLRFPALGFLRQVEAGRARRRRLRDLVVLALRCAALALAALACAGLLWRGALVGDAARPAVVVLDASASMGQVADGAAVAARARAAAARLVGTLSPRPVAVVIAGVEPVASTPEPTPAAGPALALLAEARQGLGDGDPAAAMALALRLLGGRGDCFVVTDLARGCLAGVDPAALPADVRLRLVDAGGGGDNVAVVGLAAEPGAAVAGRPVTLVARIANHGREPRRLDVRLRLSVQSAVLPIELPAGGVGTVSRSFLPEASGALEVEAELVAPPGDALAADDRRHGVLHVNAALDALVATDADIDDAAGPARPLLAALRAAGFGAKAVDGAGLAGELAGRVSPPALVATAGLRDALAPRAALAQHLDGGGAWLQIAASDADAALGSSAAAVAAHQPPAPLGDRVDVAQQERGRMAVAQARLDAPLLAAFQGRENLLGRLGVWRYRLTPQGAAADAAVLLAFADGTIALAERPAGAGRWLLMNLSPAALDGDAARGEALPLLLARLPQALLPARDDRLARDVGRAFAAGAPLALDGTVAAPVGGRVRLETPGFWRGAGGSLVAAAVPALESDLRRIDPATLGVQAGGADAALAQTATSPLWSWALVTALALLVLELALAARPSSAARMPSTARPGASPAQAAR